MWVTLLSVSPSVEPPIHQSRTVIKVHKIVQVYLKDLELLWELTAIYITCKVFYSVCLRMRDCLDIYACLRM